MQKPMYVVRDQVYVGCEYVRVGDEIEFMYHNRIRVGVVIQLKSCSRTGMIAVTVKGEHLTKCYTGYKMSDVKILNLTEE